MKGTILTDYVGFERGKILGYCVESPAEVLKYFMENDVVINAYRRIPQVTPELKFSHLGIDILSSDDIEFPKGLVISGHIEEFDINPFKRLNVEPNHDGRTIKEELEKMLDGGRGNYRNTFINICGYPETSIFSDDIFDGEFRTLYFAHYNEAPPSFDSTKALYKEFAEVVLGKENLSNGELLTIYANK